jgi:hypothetical protein
MMPASVGKATIVALLICCLGGCASHPHPNLAAMQAGWSGADARDLTPPFFDPDVVAVCDPPLGWKMDPPKTTADHVHKVWLSPSRATAYGVIHFSMPLPVGANLALGGFLDHMKKSEGNANLLSQQNDPNLPGIRFVAEGGKYTIRTNLMVDGWEGWAIYAGTLRGQPDLPNELDMAQRAREHTNVGRPDSGSK